MHFADCVIITLVILSVDTSVGNKEWVLTHSFRFARGDIELAQNKEGWP